MNTNVSASEYVRGTTLRWSVSNHAEGTEEDGSGRPPLRVRELLLAEHGRWCLTFEHPPTAPAVMRVLRTEWHMTMPEAQAFAASLMQQSVVLTRGEATLLMELLKGAGISSATIMSVPPAV